MLRRTEAGERRKEKGESQNARAVFHAELFAVSGAGGHSWRGEKCRSAQSGFFCAERRGIEARQKMEFQCGADFCDDAECAERARLQNGRTGKIVPRAKWRSGA